MRGFGDDAMKKLKAILGAYSIVYSVFLVCFAIVLFAAPRFGYHCVYDYPNVSFDTILSNVILFIIGIPIIISAFLKPEKIFCVSYITLTIFSIIFGCGFVGVIAQLSFLSLALLIRWRKVYSVLMLLLCMVLICIFFVCVMCVGNDYEYEAVMHDSPDGSITVVEKRYNDRDEYYLQKDINIGVAVLRKEILIDRTDTASNVLWSDSESFYIGERLFYTGKILSINGG